MKRSLIGIAALLLAGVCQASPYVSISAGSSTVDVCDGDADCDDGSTGFKILGGYKVMPNLAVEAGYFDFGKASVQGVTVKANGFGIGGAFHQDFSSDFSMVGRLGGARMKVDISGGGSETSTQLYGGIGLGYKVAPAWTIDAAYDFSKVKFEDEKDNVHMFSVGLTLAF